MKKQTNELYNRETSVLNSNDDPMRYNRWRLYSTLSVVFVVSYFAGLDFGRISNFFLDFLFFTQ